MCRKAHLNLQSLLLPPSVGGNNKNLLLNRKGNNMTEQEQEEHVRKAIEQAEMPHTRRRLAEGEMVPYPESGLPSLMIGGVEVYEYEDGRVCPIIPAGLDEVILQGIIDSEEQLTFEQAAYLKRVVLLSGKTAEAKNIQALIQEAARLFAGGAPSSAHEPDDLLDYDLADKIRDTTEEALGL